MNSSIVIETFNDGFSNNLKNLIFCFFYLLPGYSAVILPQLVNQPNDTLSMDYDMASWVGKLVSFEFFLEFFVRMSLASSGFLNVKMRIN